MTTINGRNQQVKPCTWDDERGWLMPEHLRDCSDNQCAGCKPCPKSHCAMRGRCPNHVEQGVGEYTCPSCIGATRRALHRIEQRYALELPDELLVSGVDSEAANLLGPAADPDQVRGRRRASLHVADFGKRRGAVIADDPHHPYAVLGRWELAVREIYSHRSDLFITVSRSVAYLSGSVLDRFAHTQEFEDFSADVATVLNHLEVVLHDSRQPEKGAPCPKCSRPMARRYGAKAKDDRWACTCGHAIDDHEYQLHAEQTHLANADILTSDGIAVRLGISASSVRRWAGTIRTVRRIGDEDVVREYPPALRPCASDAKGRWLYKVSAARDLQRGYCEWPRDRSSVSLDIKTDAVSKSG